MNSQQQNWNNKDECLFLKTAGFQWTKIKKINMALKQWNNNLKIKKPQ